MNAKEEFLEEITRIGAEVKCATIYSAAWWDKEEEAIVPRLILKVGYSKKEYDKFISDLDFNYDSGYGGQELDGKVWFTDGTWLSRGEYDGSEWWIYNKLPEIPKNLLP